MCLEIIAFEVELKVICLSIIHLSFSNKLRIFNDLGSVLTAGLETLKWFHSTVSIVTDRSERVKGKL